MNWKIFVFTDWKWRVHVHARLKDKFFQINFMLRNMVRSYKTKSEKYLSKKMLSKHFANFSLQYFNYE